MTRLALLWSVPAKGINEIADDDLLFQVMSRTSATVDGGFIHRQGAP
jgi:hypothetical protein